ncbi:ALG2, partial [Cordylochernes scorpioides]
SRKVVSAYLPLPSRGSVEGWLNRLVFDHYDPEERRTLMLKTGQLCASLPSIIDNMTQNKYIATAFYGFHKSISQKKAKQTRVVFLHPDLGIGGAERLVVDSALALQARMNDTTSPSLWSGAWIPRSLFGKCHALMAYLRMIYAAFWLGLSPSAPVPDVVYVDQVSACIPVLNLFLTAYVLFFCHFPDQLLTDRKTTPKKLYRAAIDAIEECTTGMADLVLVNSKFTVWGKFSDLPQNVNMEMKFIVYSLQDNYYLASLCERTPQAYGKHALSIKSCEYWFRRLKSGDFDTRDKERGGRPIKFEDAKLEALLDEDSSQTQEELAETLGVTQQAISNRPKVIGMVQKQGNWVPYELKPGNIERRICTKSSVKPGHGRKLMLCIWWDLLGVIYYELLQPNETITEERYQQQLMRLSRALKIKRPLYAKRHDKVIYQHDNARPHVAKVVKETLEVLQWDVLPHPLYSPDIAPSDYHMFRSMTHGLAEQHFTSYEVAKNWVNVWIASKDVDFFRHRIQSVFQETFPSLVGKVHTAVLYPSLNMAAFNQQRLDDYISDIVKFDSKVQCYFLSLNRFERKKNLGLALKALKALHQKLKEDQRAVGLVVAGGYDPNLKENQEYLAELEKEAKTLGIEEYVNFVRSPDETIKMHLIHSCLAVVYTPQNEHFGIVPLEAMYLNRPVIAVNSGGPLETVKHRETGLLCDPTPAAFSEAMKELFLSRSFARDMGIQGHHHVKDNFSYDNFAHRLDGFVKGLSRSQRVREPLQAFITPVLFIAFSMFSLWLLLTGFVVLVKAL